MTDTPTPNPAGSGADEPTQQIPPVPAEAAPAAPEAFPAAPAAQPGAPVPPAPQAPAAPQYGGQPTATAAKPTNPLAIVALIGSFFVGLVGIICGHIALNQIKKSNGQQGGRGLALAGTIIGYVNVAVVALFIIFSIVAASLAVSAATSASEQLQSQLDQLPEITDEPTDTPTDEPTTDASGDRSAEFCAAFDEASNASGEVSSDGSLSEEMLTAYKHLAEVDSPNQAVYARFYEVAKDPSSLTKDEDPENLMKDYLDAVMADTAACAG